MEELSGTIAELAAALVDGMAIVEQWGRAADTYEVMLAGQMLERLRAVQDIPSIGVGGPEKSGRVFDG
ncbi:hypothetical protein D3C78_1680970 [compost metagenome]